MTWFAFNCDLRHPLVCPISPQMFFDMLDPHVSKQKMKSESPSKSEQLMRTCDIFNFSGCVAELYAIFIMLWSAKRRPHQGGRPQVNAEGLMPEVGGRRPQTLVAHSLPRLRFRLPCRAFHYSLWRKELVVMVGRVAGAGDEGGG